MGTSDHHAQTSEIDSRLARIEAELAAAHRDARRWRLGAVSVAGLAVVGGLAAAVQVARVEDVIRVRRLEVVGEGDKVAYRALRTGPMVDGLRVVRDGVKPGERIVVNGLQRVQPGMVIKPRIVPMEGDSGAAAP